MNGALILHRALRKTGVDSVFLCDGYQEPASSVSLFNENLLKLSRASEGLWRHLFRKDTYFTLGRTSLAAPRRNELASFDLVHLHWTNGGRIALNLIRDLGLPIVWTVRDLWPITGGCHYPLDCRGYESGCPDCPRARAFVPASLVSATAAAKQRLYRDCQITFVFMSEDNRRRADQSFVMSDHARKVIIPNLIDETAFYPEPNARAALQKLGIDLPARYILAGALDQNDAYKGFSSFFKIYEGLSENVYAQGLSLVTFGTPFHDAPSSHAVHLGPVRDPNLLRLFYSAADVFITPSIQEAFVKTLIEALACGTPVIARQGLGGADIAISPDNGALFRSDAELASLIMDFAYRSAQGSLPRVSGLPEGLRGDSITQQYKALYAQLVTGDRDRTCRSF